jgi:hypothetical protein
MSKVEKASELEWLRWFYEHAELNVGKGLTREDEVHILKEVFCDQTGKALPDGYRIDDEVI